MAGEALVAVRRVGICGTDFHAYAGTQNFFAYPRVLGHELAVEVLALGPHPTARRTPRRPPVGDHCAVLPVPLVRAVPACRWGPANCCERIEVLGVTVDGGLRERMLRADLGTARPARPDRSTSWRSSRLSGSACTPWSGPGPQLRHGARRRNRSNRPGRCPVPGGRVAAVAVTDRSRDRLAFARRTLGVASALDGADLVRALADQFGGELPTLVFDATGSRASMERPFELVGAGGRLVLVGHTTGSSTSTTRCFTGVSSRSSPRGTH